MVWHTGFNQGQQRSDLRICFWSHTVFSAISVLRMESICWPHPDRQGENGIWTFVFFFLLFFFHPLLFRFLVLWLRLVLIKFYFIFKARWTAQDDQTVAVTRCSAGRLSHHVMDRSSWSVHTTSTPKLLLFFWLSWSKLALSAIFPSARDRLLACFWLFKAVRVALERRCSCVVVHNDALWWNESSGQFQTWIATVGRNGDYRKKE